MWRAWLLALFITGAWAQEAVLPGHLVVRACEDDAEWPPFTFYERVQGKATDRLTGAAVEAMDRILERAGIAHTLVLLPWKRCQEEIKAGLYHLALNASYSDQRARDYWLGRPFYRLHSHYYWSRRVHPQGLDIRSLAELKRWRVCGMLGYNYSTYGLQPADMDLSPSSFQVMINKLHHDRCDLFVEKREVMAGFGAVDPAMARDLADPDLGTAPLPGVPPTTFHMIVTRAQPWGRTLARRLDEGLVQMEASGELQALFARYLK